MRHPHTLRRALLVAATTLAAVPLMASPAAAAVVKPIVFPVDGQVTYTDTFGACRDGCTRYHEGQDLMGKKMLPLLAAVDGVVHRVTFNNTSSGGNSVVVKGADGWTYHYLHVNNDTPGTDDAKATRAQAFPSDIVLGAPVSRGQVIGYLGDSGNAENAGSHLHFEIRQPAAPGSYTGTPINPYESLQQASRFVLGSSRWVLRRSLTNGPVEDLGSYYNDVDGDRPLLCDWDGDGLDEAVVFRAGSWLLRDGVTTGKTVRRVAFGGAADIPLCGNVDADVADEMVVFNAGTWTIRAGFGTSDAILRTVTYGATGDQVILGDWDGNGRDDLGTFAGSTWYLRTSAESAGATRVRLAWGDTSTDLALAGDWNRDGVEEPGLYRQGTWLLRAGPWATAGTRYKLTFGSATDTPVVGQLVRSAGLGYGVVTPGS